MKPPDTAQHSSTQLNTAHLRSRDSIQLDSSSILSGHKVFYITLIVLLFALPFKISAQSGKAFFIEPYNKSVEENNIQLDMSTFSPGVYVVSLIVNGQVQDTKNLIKN